MIPLVASAPVKVYGRQKNLERCSFVRRTHPDLQDRIPRSTIKRIILSWLRNLASGIRTLRTLRNLRNPAKPLQCNSTLLTHYFHLAWAVATRPGPGRRRHLPYVTLRQAQRRHHNLARLWLSAWRIPCILSSTSHQPQTPTNLKHRIPIARLCLHASLTHSAALPQPTNSRPSNESTPHNLLNKRGSGDTPVDSANPIRRQAPASRFLDQPQPIPRLLHDCALGPRMT